jgi:diguanylate cyclase (GGDEF)-like protein
MNLDVYTLFYVTIYVEVILGLLLLFAWVQNTASYAVAWWGFAHFLRAGSVVLFGMNGTVSELYSIDLANSLLFTAFALTWTGARVFGHRRPQPALIFGGAVLWLVLSRLSGIAGSWEVRALISSGIIAAYTWAAAYEFWRGRSESLISRWPLIFMLFAHGSLYLLRTPLGAKLSSLPPDNEIFRSVWPTTLSFEGLLFTISIAFLLLAMAKERTERRYKAAALIDPLTGIANRRAFVQQSEALLKRSANGRRPTTVMLLDIDKFKSINDRFGHAVGDRVLQTLAEVGNSCLPRTDLFCRLGGEEFAALLVDATREDAIAVADRIRLSFAAATGELRDNPVAATVSIGVAFNNDAPFDLTLLMAQADHALYRAKHNGRNRVEVMSNEPAVGSAVQSAADLLMPTIRNSAEVATKSAA